MSLNNDNQQHTAELTGFNSIEPQTLIAAAPSGWFTVATWWALVERGALGLLSDPLTTLQEQDALLEARRSALGLPAVWVASCPALAARSIAKERAYPEALLLECYPANP